MKVINSSIPERVKVAILSKHSKALRKELEKAITKRDYAIMNELVESITSGAFTKIKALCYFNNIKINIIRDRSNEFSIKQIEIKAFGKFSINVLIDGDSYIVKYSRYESVNALPLPRTVKVYNCVSEYHHHINKPGIENLIYKNLKRGICEMKNIGGK